MEELARRYRDVIERRLPYLVAEYGTEVAGSAVNRLMTTDLAKEEEIPNSALAALHKAILEPDCTLADVTVVNGARTLRSG